MKRYSVLALALLLALHYVTLLATPSSAEPMNKSSAHITSRSLVEDLTGTLGVAPPTGARPLSLITISLLKDFEGWAPAAYDDPSGFCTIGYGHLISLKRCAEISLDAFAKNLSEAEGENLLEKDTCTARVHVQQLVKVELTDSEFGALSSFVFNIGKENFATSTLLSLLNANERQAAAAEFRRWVKSKGQVYSGLVDRRSCEATLFLGQLTLDKQGRFNRQQCKSLGAAPPDGTLIDIEVGEQREGRK